MNLREKLEELRLPHYVCEDCWYSCPMAPEEDYCGGLEPGSKCNCGADRHNAILDEILLANP